MVDFDFLQEAGRRARFKLALEGGKLPGHVRTVERSPEKQALLLQAVRDAYQRSPARWEERDGGRVLILPWMLLP